MTKTRAKMFQKCRCCTNPSSKFYELDATNKSCGTNKTFKDVLYEITNIKVSDNQEKYLIQKICQKCSTQLNNCFKFVQQARQVYEQYLQAFSDLCEQDESKDHENMPEPLVEDPIGLIPIEKCKIIIRESPIARVGSPLEMYEIKSEPYTDDHVNGITSWHSSKSSVVKEERTDCAENIKEESTPTCKAQENSLQDGTKDPTYEEERDHFDSEDDEDTEEDPISENDFDKDLSKVPIAISCDICHKVYKDKVALRTHKHYTHMPEEKKRPCPLCSFKSSRLSNLKVHIKGVHGADKVKEVFKPAEVNGVQFPCTICQQTFGRKDTLQRHIKGIHQNPQPRGPRKKENTTKEKERFLCNYCGGSFRTKSILSRHVVIHSGERPFPCEICQKTFKLKKDLHMHRKIHSDAKPHQCIQCGKAFNRSDKLKIHMRVHSEVRPYKCTRCEKTFKYPNVLSTHMLTHTGRNRFECKICDEIFSYRSSFNAHCLEKGHVDLKEYSKFLNPSVDAKAGLSFFLKDIKHVNFP